jgi:DNA-directed RNA polymerase specialized sigma24 family protein
MSQSESYVTLRGGASRAQDTAEILGVSPGTIKRDWTLANAWLQRELKKNETRDER